MNMWVKEHPKKSSRCPKTVQEKPFYKNHCRRHWSVFPPWTPLFLPPSIPRVASGKTSQCLNHKTTGIKRAALATFWNCRTSAKLSNNSIPPWTCTTHISNTEATQIAPHTSHERINRGCLWGRGGPISFSRVGTTYKLLRTALIVKTQWSNSSMCNKGLMDRAEKIGVGALKIGISSLPLIHHREFSISILIPFTKHEGVLGFWGRK